MKYSFAFLYVAATASLVACMHQPGGSSSPTPTDQRRLEMFISNTPIDQRRLEEIEKMLIGEIKAAQSERFERYSVWLENIDHRILAAEVREAFIEHPECILRTAKSYSKLALLKFAGTDLAGVKAALGEEEIVVGGVHDLKTMWAALGGATDEQIVNALNKYVWSDSAERFL